VIGRAVDGLRCRAAAGIGVRRFIRRERGSGLVTAIIAGVVIAILGGASYQISGPTGRDERGARRHRRGS